MKAKDVVRRLINRKIDDFVSLADRDPYVSVFLKICAGSEHQCASR